MAKKQIRSKYTEDFVPVKSITNGMIVLDNNEKVSGIGSIMSKLLEDYRCDRKFNVIEYMEKKCNKII